MFSNGADIVIRVLQKLQFFQIKISGRGHIMSLLLLELSHYLVITIIIILKKIIALLVEQIMKNTLKILIQKTYFFQ